MLKQSTTTRRSVTTLGALGLFAMVMAQPASAGPATPQATTRLTGEGVEGSDIYRWAQEAAKSRAFRSGTIPIRSTGPTVPPPDGRKTPGSGRESNSANLPHDEILTGDNLKQTRLRELVRAGRRLNADILRAGPGMSPAEARRYERSMRDLVGRMDGLTRKVCNGKPKKGTLAACMCECDEAYQGWGGGKGWNRFVCMGGCLTAKTLGN